MQYNGSNYNDWVNYEYDLWKNELKKLSEDPELFKNFKQNDQVKRMLGSSDLFGPFFERIKDKDLPWKEIEKIDQIGNPTHVIDVNSYKISGICLRYIYYADKVLNELKEFDSRLDLNMLEIGGGYGGFASVLNCLLKFANKQIDLYGIFDLPEVQDFQSFYLAKTVMHSYGINDFFFPKVLTFIGTDFNYLVSFYALGEFPAELKKHYIKNVIAKVPHGFIVWNPHFGPDDEGIELIKRVQPNVQITKEDPLTAEFNLEIKW
jgi:hypothetical protein